MTFEYTAIRVWETSVEALLAGGPGTLPLAPLSNVTPEQLPDVERRMRDRVDAEKESDAEAAEFWTTTSILLGLRLRDTQISELLKGVRQMKESTTYQAILQEGKARGEARGRAQEARKIVLRLGERRFGEPLEAVRSSIEAITSVDRLNLLIDQIQEVESWDELLVEL